MTSFPQFVRNQYKHLPVSLSREECQGATYIVTGANTGLGFECAKHLVRFSCKKVILGVRSLKKGEEAKSKIEAETGNTGIAEVWHLDLTSYDTVKEFAKKVQELDRVDAIIENAGVALGKWSVAEGLETTLTVNNVSTTLLAVLVLPKLQESAKKFVISPHLVIIGSNVMFEAKGELEKINGDIFEGLNKGINNKRYQTSKLLQMYAVRQLASMRPISEAGVIINCVSPGLCVTELSRNAPLSFRILITIMHFLLGRTAEEGSRTLLHGAAAGKESHGRYLSDCELKEDPPAPWITAAMQKRVWDSLSKRLEAIQPGCIKNLS